MSPARIIILNHFFYPDEAATSQLCTQLAQKLSENPDWHVTGLCGRTRYASPVTLPTGLSQHGQVTIERLWCTDFGTKTIPGRICDYLTFLIHAAWRLTFGPRPDLIIVMTSPPLVSFLGAWTHWIRKAKFIYWVQDLYPEVVKAGNPNLSPFLYSLLLKIADWIDSQTQAHVVLGHCMSRQLLERSADQKTKNVRLIPNWTIIPENSEAHSDFRKEHGLENSFVLMYSGNLGRAHDWQTFMEGYQMCHQKNSSIRLVIIGYGAGHIPLKQWLSNHPDLPVLFLPHQPARQLPQILRSADLHIISQLPSFDGLLVPSKFYGVAAVGRPVLFIGSHQNEVALKVTQNSLGNIFKPGDSASVSAFILQCVENRQLLESMSHNMAEWHRREGQPQHRLDEWAGLAKQLLTVKK